MAFTNSGRNLGAFARAVKEARESTRTEFVDPGYREASGQSLSYRQARERVEEYLHEAPKQSFDDIIGNEDALSQLQDAIEAPVKHKKLYEAYNMRMPKGALLCGPPGCGKTMFARAAASTMQKLYNTKEFISVSGAELQSPYVGVTEAKIKAMFDFAREYKKQHKCPLLIFMDEADALLPDRTGRVRRVASWEESQVATFLAEMDGMHESGAFVLLATNRPEVIDQAVLRDGRCDFKITVKKPTIDAIKVIIKNNFKDCLLHDKVDDLIFAATECFTDPHKVIAHAEMVWGNDEKIIGSHGKDFTLEYILSGAMAASLPYRAARYAFNRDKKNNRPQGIKVEDVIAAVNDIFEENAGLEHSFALNEFKREFGKEVQGKMNEQNKKLN